MRKNPQAQADGYVSSAAGTISQHFCCTGKNISHSFPHSVNEGGSRQLTELLFKVEVGTEN